MYKIILPRSHISNHIIINFLQEKKLKYEMQRIKFPIKSGDLLEANEYTLYSKSTVNKVRALIKITFTE